LRFRRTNFDDEDMMALIAGMASNPDKPIKSLEFHDTYLGANCTHLLSAYLKDANPINLESLSFSFINNLLNMDIFANMLKINTHLKKLTFISNSFKPYDM
jgi:hypothetical protein